MSIIDRKFPGAVKNYAYNLKSLFPVKSLPEYAATAVLEELMADALAAGSSDIHIEHRKDGGTLRHRVNDKFQEAMDLSYAELFSIVSAYFQALGDHERKPLQSAEITPYTPSISLSLPYGKELKVFGTAVLAYPTGFDLLLRVVRVDNSTRLSGEAR